MNLNSCFLHRGEARISHELGDKSERLVTTEADLIPNVPLSAVFKIIVIKRYSMIREITNFASYSGGMLNSSST